MCILKSFLKVLLIVLVSISVLSLPVHAASSSLIRAYDDLNPTSNNFSGQNLQEAEFSSTKLEGADFSTANLQGAVFNGVILKSANFHGADFSNGIAYLSNFANADLSDAIFTSAMLLQSKFWDANIEGADFSMAVIDRAQQKHLCGFADGVNSTTGVATRDSLGC